MFWIFQHTFERCSTVPCPMQYSCCCCTRQRYRGCICPLRQRLVGSQSISSYHFKCSSTFWYVFVIADTFFVAFLWIFLRCALNSFHVTVNRLVLRWCWAMFEYFYTYMRYIYRMLSNSWFLLSIIMCSEMLGDGGVYRLVRISKQGCRFGASFADSFTMFRHASEER